MKVPPRILPDIPKKGTEADGSTSHTDFVKLPVVPRKSYKPEEKAHMCEAKLDDTTSYKLDFPQQKSTTSNSRGTMNNMIPKIGEIPLKENYHAGFTEHPNQNLEYLTEKNCGKSTNGNGFGSAAFETKGMRKTTNMSGLPALIDKQPVYLKKKSRKHCETMQPPTGHLQKWTQYQIDNPGYVFFPQARGICTPAPDQLQLFQGPFDGKTENHLNFIQFREPPRPRTSFKKRDEAHVIQGATFYDTTSSGTHYQPIPYEQQFAELKSVDRLAAQVGRYQKDGQQMKRAHNFGGKFTDLSVNKSDYFQFWELGPRKRHGDRAERLFQPSKAKLASVSESHANFVAQKGKPSESFKPLDTRFKEQKKSKEIKMDYGTVYERDFKEKQLPLREICPAELILQQA